MRGGRVIEPPPLCTSTGLLAGLLRRISVPAYVFVSEEEWRMKRTIIIHGRSLRSFCCDVVIPYPFVGTRWDFCVTKSHHQFGEIGGFKAVSFSFSNAVAFYCRYLKGNSRSFIIHAISVYLRPTEPYGGWKHQLMHMTSVPPPFCGFTNGLNRTRGSLRRRPKPNDL